MMRCANDPWASDHDVCLSPVVGAYLTVIADGVGDPLPVIVPSCAAHTSLIAGHLEEIAETNGLWVNAQNIEDAAAVMRDALGMPVHAHSLVLAF